MTKSYIFRWDILPAIKTAWPQFPDNMDAAGIELSDQNDIIMFEAYGEDDSTSFDLRFDLATIPANSQRALVALALTHGDPCAS